MTDRSYPKVYLSPNGDKFVVQSGGSCSLEPGAVGGLVSSAISATDDVTAVASNGAYVAHAQKVTIPANTFNAGNRVRVKAAVRVTDASGAVTLQTKITIGGSDLISTVAVDPGAAGDCQLLEFELVARAAAGAAVSCQGAGKTVTNTGGALVHGAKMGSDGASNSAEFALATNGDLDIKVQSKWSATNASTSARLDFLTVEVE